MQLCDAVTEAANFTPIQFRPLACFIYRHGSCSVDSINCSLVIQVSRQRQSDALSEVYLDVAVILSKWRGHQIIKLSHKFIMKLIYVVCTYKCGLLWGNIITILTIRGIPDLTVMCNITNHVCKSLIHKEVWQTHYKI